MADSDTTVHIGENSPEQVAFKLLQEIAYAEGKNMFNGPAGDKPDRAWILEAYRQCRRTVSGLAPEKS